MYKGIVNILCTSPGSNYNKITGVQTWDKKRNAYNFTGRTPVIAHPPCQQWSKLRRFAKEDEAERNLAPYCLDVVNRNGGILEHPEGSLLWKIGDFTLGKIISVNQSWFGFYTKKPTLLYFVKCSPISHPITFDCPTRTFYNLSTKQRNETVPRMAQWLINSLIQTFDNG